MTTSASTPRLRLTQTWYGILIPLCAIAGPAGLAPVADAFATAIAWLLVAAAFLGRIWCSVFIAGRKDAQLVTDGPYARCRHPLYSLSLLAGVGLGLGTRSWLLTAITLGLLSVLFLRASRSEDALLANLHGERFRDYAARTPRFWPKSWPQRATMTRAAQTALPERIEVLPRVFWKAFLDAGSFALLLALIDLARRLRETGVLPTLLPVP
jgi:protein-S-isoprenylcysteine O-methyltransferase Ste14